MLLKAFDKMDARNRSVGWRRYDWADLDSHPWIFGKAGRTGRLIRLAVRTIDVIVAYGEGLAAIYWALRCGALKGATAADQAILLAPRILDRVLRFLDRGSGDVACAVTFGRPYNIQSLRWASGPLMEAIVYGILIDEEDLQCQ